jgi:hypothetical protein
MTDADYHAWNAHLREVSELEKQLLVAQAGGCPVDDPLRSCQAIKARLDMMKAAYFGDRP